MNLKPSVPASFDLGPIDQAEKKTKPISMHEDVPIWGDCCPCEAEPYWVEAMIQFEGDQHQKEGESGS